VRDETCDGWSGCRCSSVDRRRRRPQLAKRSSMLLS
jgi:hypothetical protein